MSDGSDAHGLSASQGLPERDRVRRADTVLDVLRCVAATLVVAAHWRILLFQDFPTLRTPSVDLKAFYFFTGIGRPSVVVFFVLSGYLVTGSALRARAKGTWSVSSYLNQRITRLGVVLFPALLLGFMWDELGLRFYPHGFYDGFIRTIALRPDVAARHGMGILVQNALFLQGITTTTYGTNDPLWSLSYEFWYYILLIPLLSMFAPSAFWRRILHALAIVVILCFVGKAIAVSFLVWLLGAAIAFATQHRRVSPARENQGMTVVSGLGLAASLIATRARVLPDGMSDFVIGLCCAWFIWCAVQDRRSIRPNWITRGSANYAGWSYTLYLVHMPILVFIAALMIRRTQWSPSLPHELVACCILAGVLLYAYLISLLTEKKTNAIRRWFAGIAFPVRSASPAGLRREN